MKRLIINADDFGISHETNVAVAELLANRQISSASLMANGRAYAEAVEMIRSEGLTGIGIHLALTGEPFMGRNQGRIYRDSADLAGHANDADMVDEIKRQITAILADGIDVTHVDNHMYSLMPRMGYRGYRIFFEAWRQLRTDRKIGIRIARSYYLVANINYIWSGRKLKPYLWWKMLRHKLMGVDYSFAFPYYAPDHRTMERKRELLHGFLSTLRDGCTELHIHPAISPPPSELEKQNPYWPNRVHEYELLKELSPDLLRQKYGIELISYRDLL